MTETQDKIKDMYIKQIPISDIAKTLNCTKRYVYKTLKQMQLLRSSQQFTNGNTLVHRHGKYRLHATHLVIHIINKGIRFNNIKDKEGYIDTHHFKICENNTIQLHQAIGEQFPSSIYADDLKELNQLANDYWYNIIIRLQRRLDCLLLKEGFPTFHEARSHIAYTESGVAKTVVLEQGKGIYFYNEYGKAFIYFDMSHGVVEHEYIEGMGNNWETSKRIEPYFKDLYHKEWYKPSEVKSHIDSIVNALDLIVKDRKFYAENMNSHIKAIQKLAMGVDELRAEVKRINKPEGQKRGLSFLNDKWEREYKDKQTKLKEW